MIVTIDNKDYACSRASVGYYTEGARNIDLTFVRTDLENLVEELSPCLDVDISIGYDTYKHLMLMHITKEYSEDTHDQGVPKVEVRASFVNSVSLTENN